MTLGLLAALAVSACAESDGSSVTLPIPKLPPRVMLEKLDLNVPTDINAADLNASATPALAVAPAFNVLAGTQSPDDAARALDCLTKAVYYEAGNQSDDGQRAVAQVVLNRVRDRAFPSSVCGVVYQGSQRSTGCQFTFTCDGSLARRPSEAGWIRARAVASSALAGSVYAPVGSATFYHANYVSPWWANSMDKVATVGAHIFYRWRGGMENALAFRQRYSGSEPSLTGRIPVPGDSIASAGATAGVETVGSVMIHRGLVAPATVSVNGAPTKVAAVATSAPTMGKLIRVGGGRGVRVYRGTRGPASTEDLSGQAVVD
ncbi:MAG: cell wall hydrolase [Sphingomonas sp.]|uniref:cell wall hydrolase n=1 Tax=Sphingomonas sp. TaxID=28214 RepID=UPI001202B711|nr:cell wall hydrolase [Sphingomonas sp.]THD34515.1 MAG: cell wall hydrolase [Sphingomonas sp.]